MADISPTPNSSWTIVNHFDHLYSKASKMFRRTEQNLPQDPDFPADLHALGFKINEHGQFVKIDAPNTFFDFFHTDNERANEVRKERLHECVRQSVLSSLASQDVKQLYVFGGSCSEAKPEGQHTSILTTQLEKLKTKQDVLVIINEHMQDLGIWAYRLLMREAGIEGGSAVGLMKKLQVWGANAFTENSLAGVSYLGSAVEKLKLDGASNDLDETMMDCNTPGVIILNPGQLIYSPQLNKAMSQAEWLGRPKPTALSDHYRIDDDHNRVPCHKTPEQHVATVFEQIIPAITREDVRLYVVGLSDGGEALLKFLDRKFHADPQDDMGKLIEAIALIEPTHDPKQLESVALATFLAGRRCRAYVMSQEPKGSLVAVPKPAIPLSGRLYDSRESLEADAQRSLTDSARHVREGSESSTSPPIAIPGASPSPVQTSNRSSIFGTVGNFSHPRSLEAKSSSYSLPNSHVNLQQSTGSLRTNASARGESTLEKSTSTLSTSVALRNAAAIEDEVEPDPFADVHVSCPTFSSGPLSFEVTEMIWPAVMDDVVNWFKDVAEEAEETENLAKESEMVFKKMEAKRAAAEENEAD
ncbi:hypothetical protein KC327_g14348 [Hortaea werneckii]|uniref:Arb2 domain-containing protein n=1 Tax=Hortaea werneckii EXF-2000 TaxID=1157616 RepID=A0A1Z5TT66_HORWE|nr:hypothetical protein KC358_g10274 [Hortaea werneckii]OTA39121.1 hypothetical protein BTJ68_00958 [Hortaea werneckii EXF-2000]KAI6908955.1 hypothetical protein KC348_g13654 [Hortaea werneckii]KAI6936197.1 hypothetical protein KC341_g6407 [Hortaea werneckii]KAI6965302.1 hypothetical protein KC321_g10173 [Hortaea werneckii]